MAKEYAELVEENEELKSACKYVSSWGTKELPSLETWREMVYQTKEAMKG